MCGFTGIVDHNKNYLSNIGSIEHRGPDNTTIKEGVNWTIKFHRLSINDLSSNGNQPFTFKKITAFINGEIYNHKDLKEKYFKNENFISNSDCEIVPRLYHKFGIEFVKNLDGMFSMAIIDDEKKKVFLIKDAFGKKPLYYNNEPFCFSSEARFVNNFEIRKENIQFLLSAHYRFFDRTVYKNIKALPPGYYLEYYNKSIKLKQWYKPNINLIEKKNNQINQINSLLQNSVKKRLMADVDIGVFLSGGLDSNIILQILSNICKKRINTFTAILKFDNKNENTTDDKEKIVENTKNLNVENNFVIIDKKFLNNNLIKIICGMDQPILDTGYIIAYALSNEAKKKNCKVILSGIGGDECFGGYEWQSRYIGKNFIKNRIVSLFSKTNFFFKNFENKIVNYLFFPYYLHLTSLGHQFFKKKKLKIQQNSKILVNESMNKIIRNYKKTFSNDFRNMLDFLNIFGVMNHQLTIFDLACMKNSIENRSPFLDKSFFEHCLSISSKKKDINKDLLRKILKKHYPNYVSSDSPKKGPVIRFNYLFDDEKTLIGAKNFLVKNKYIIEKYISKELAFDIENNFLDCTKENYGPLISIIILVIWLRYNSSGDINESTKLESLFE